MRTIIAGSQTITDLRFVEEALSKCPWKPTVVISGHAPGVDKLGEEWARKNSVDTIVCEANWRKYGHAAGRIRNLHMADIGEALVAVWNGKSPGTRHMIDTANERFWTHIFVFLVKE